MCHHLRARVQFVADASHPSRAAARDHCLPVPAPACHERSAPMAIVFLSSRAASYTRLGPAHYGSIRQPSPAEAKHRRIERHGKDCTTDVPGGDRRVSHADAKSVLPVPPMSAYVLPLRAHGTPPKKPSGPSAVSRAPPRPSWAGPRGLNAAHRTLQPSWLVHHSRDTEDEAWARGLPAARRNLPSPQRGGTAPDARRGAWAGQGGVATPGRGCRMSEGAAKERHGRIMRSSGAEIVQPTFTLTGVNHPQFPLSTHAASAA
jgi:hypothetical protein